MAKTRTVFLCSACGATHPRWNGRCPDCGTWDTLESFREPPAAATAASGAAHGGVAEIWVDPAGAAPVVKATALPDIETVDVARLPTGVAEFDRVLGGGLVPGSVVLLGGDPGIGKSTLLLQAAGRLAAGGRRVLYVTSEESAVQTRLRAERLFEHEPGGGLDGLADLFVLADTSLPRVVEQARQVRPAVMVLDSIQMVFKPDLEASPGSVTQIRRCCTDLVYLAKVSGMAILLVGHVTKDGQLAGPRLLEHLVDAVLSFEGDRHHAYRIVRGIKNRFGTTLEVGLFEMTGHGLRELADAGALLDRSLPTRPGAVICPAVHGTRTLLAEIQALTATGILGAAKRKVSGLDTSRLAMLVAVLEKHGGLRLADQDVFVSSMGGMKVTEPAADLAIALAIAGAHLRRAVPSGTAVVGEIGLGGEVRPVHQLEARAREAARLGFTRLLVGRGGAGTVRIPGLSIEAADTVSDAIDGLDVSSSGGGSASSTRRRRG
ncbi:MAG: DNA repair protein RadA [Phycisphaerales bacterium]|nr:DNA repair protein RadA [Phycisphaerales bacterium]